MSENWPEIRGNSLKVIKIRKEKLTKMAKIDQRIHNMVEKGVQIGQK